MFRFGSPVIPHTVLTERLGMSIIKITGRGDRTDLSDAGVAGAEDIKDRFLSYCKLKLKVRTP
jgi:hypothetical protein